MGQELSHCHELSEISISKSPGLSLSLSLLLQSWFFWPLVIIFLSIGQVLSFHHSER